MNTDVVTKFEELRASISDNTNTIRVLLFQADKLNNLVCGLSDDDEQKVALENSIKELYQIINRLIKQTNSLFQQYAEFARSVHKVKS